MIFLYVDKIDLDCVLFVVEKVVVLVVYEFLSLMLEKKILVDYFIYFRSDFKFF